MSAKSSHGEILQMAFLYDHLGCSVLPLKTRTKEPAIRWKPYQERRPNRDELQEWFSGGRRNIGIICGDVSDRLVVRDFDCDASYRDWQSEYPEPSKSLPTVRTARGFHVYARSAESISTEHLSDGEIRSNGHYVAAPPSIHPEGPTYSWTIPPGDDIPLIDLGACGLLTDWSQGNTVAQAICATVSLCDCATVLPSSVDTAIRRTIPPNIGWREKCLFRLCRELQAIPEYANADPTSLEPIVRAWYEVAKANIGTKEYEVTLAAFIRAWGNVKVPKGQTAAYAAFERAKSCDHSWIPSRFESDALRLLIALCRELQAINGKRPFYLDCRTCGDLLGVTHKTAWQYLDTLCTFGVIKKVSSGSLKTRKANEYRFL